MSAEILLGAAVAGVLLVGGALSKNKIEDEITAAKDSFTRWDSLFQKYATLNSVDPWMLKAIAMNESSLGDAPSVARGIASPKDVEGSKSSDGKSWGLMQMTIPTALDFDRLATAEKLNDPEYSVKLASKLLRSLKTQFDQEEYVVKAYNQGAGNMRKELGGQIEGYAEEYWNRYQRNRELIRKKQGV